MPIDPRVFVDGIEDHNVHDAMHRGFGVIHDRLLLLEATSGANPTTQVDSPSSPPPPQNPAPQNPSSLDVKFNVATGFYTVTITAPWNTPSQSGSEVSRRASGSVPVGITATYRLQSSPDPNFLSGVTDYGIGQQHLFTVPGAAGLNFRVFTSIDGGQTFGRVSPARNIASL